MMGVNTHKRQIPRREITREKLIEATQIASMHLAGIDRDDVLAFVEGAPRVAAGAWSLIYANGERCYCPISGAGIDRLKETSGNFAIAFDAAVGASNAQRVILEVID